MTTALSIQSAEMSKGVKPSLRTRAFFRSPSKGIAEFAAGEIGEKEIKKASENYSYGADPVRDGVSTGNPGQVHAGSGLCRRG